MTGLLGVLCCCGVPGYLAWAPARQWPVTAVLPQSFADLDLRDDTASRRALDKLATEVQGSGGDAFAGVYADGAGKRVTVFGATGLRLTPEADVEAQVQRLAGEFDLDRVRAFDLGEAGAHERCAVGRVGGSSTVVCAWADHGSLATVLLTRRSVDESADLVARLRSSVLTRG